MAKTAVAKQETLIPKKGIRRFVHNFIRDWQLYVMIAIPVIYIFIFSYLPMYGIQIAFKTYSPRKGIWGSDWVGLENWSTFFGYYRWTNIVWNTLALSLYDLFVVFPLPIILALIIHVHKGKALKKFAQNLSYVPHFISLVVMIGILNTVLNPISGLLGVIYRMLNIRGVSDIRTSAEAFRHLYIWSGVWKNIGWSSILYVSCLSGVPEELHEAAKLDGASRLRRIWSIDIPTIMPTVGLMLIMNCASLLSVGYTKAYLMQSTTNLETSELISTYVYKQGIMSGNMSFGSAIGLMQSVISLGLTCLANWVASTLTDGEIALF